MKLFSPPLGALLQCIILSLTVSGLVAQTVVPTGTWSGQGTDNDLNTAANWGGDAVPASGATATWAGFEAGNLNLTFGSSLGGTTGFDMAFTADQTGNVTISNAETTARNIRLRSATTGWPLVFSMAAGAGQVQFGTLTGTANEIQILFGGGTGTKTAQINNNSSNEWIFGSNVNILTGGGTAGDLAFYGTGTTRILGGIFTNPNEANKAASAIRVRNGRLVLEGANASNLTGNIMADSGMTEFTSMAAIGTGAAASFIRIGQANLSGTLRYSGAGDAVVNRQISLGNGANATHTGNATIESTGTGKVVFSHPSFNLDATQHASVTRTLTLGGGSTAANEIQGIIANNAAGAGTVALEKVNTGRWVLSAANSFTGDTTVREGTLRLAHANALSASTLELRGGTLEIGDGFTVSLGAGLSTNVRNTTDLKAFSIQTTGSATGGFNSDIRIIDTGSRFSIHAAAGDTLTLSGNVFSNSAATQTFSKTGEGILVLSGSDTASERLLGENTVAAGALLLTGNFANAPGSFTVQDGAAIGGNGTWGGNLTLNNGAGIVFDAGDGLTVNGTANLGSLGVSNLVGLSSSTPAGFYPVISGPSLNTSAIQNLGFANAQTSGNRAAWFEVSGTTLNLHTSDLFTYTVDNGEATITGYNGPGGLVRVPDELDGNSVVAIAANTFQNNTAITRMILPTGITQLGDSAFAGTPALQWILFRGDAPSLGSGVFAGTSAQIFYRRDASGWDMESGFGGLAIQRWDIAMNRVLGRGINFGNSFDAPCETCWGNPWQPEYFETIAAEAFDHLRLPVRWEPADRSMSEPPYTIFPAFFARIQEVVDKALAEGMPVVLNMHHHDELFYAADAATFAGQRARYIAQWAQIAEFFNDYPEDLLFFELMNEPHDNVTPAIWNEMIVEGLAEVRAVNPDRIVLIGTALRGGINGLFDLVLPADDALILTPHYYEPFTFTHQSSHVPGSEAWAGTQWRDSQIERDGVLDDLALITDFAQANNIPVHIGEFGAHGAADFDSRVRYLRFLTRTFEALDMSWAVWQFTAGFSLTDPDTKQFIPELLNAVLYDSLPPANEATLTPVYTSHFSSGTDGWFKSENSGAQATLTGGGGELSLNVTTAGSLGWHVQLTRSGLNLVEGNTYLVTITGRSPQGRSAGLYVSQAGTFNPYSAIENFSFPSEGVTRSFLFTMTQADDSNARITFDLGLQTGELILNEVKVQQFDVLFTDPADFAGWIDDFFPGETDPAIVGPSADPDGDGLTNEEEWILGTDPSDPNSRFMVNQVIADGGESGQLFELTFPTLAGRNYILERSTTLQAGSWSPVGDAIAGDGNPATFSDTMNQDRAFYRIRVELAGD